ncbi:MAG: glutathione S-transferase family protein [Oceanococcus sp.]
MSKPILYGHPVSIFVRKTRLALKISGVDFEHKIVLPHADDAEFLAASPLGKIPAFRDEHVGCADSTVICHYLDKFYCNHSLIPQDRVGFTQTLWLEEYADTVIMPAAAGHLFAEHVLAGRLFPRPPNQADIDKAINEELPKIYALLDEKLQGREWFVGSSCTLADIAVGSMLLAALHCGQSPGDDTPALKAWVARFLALPEVSAVVAEEVGVLQSMRYESPLG